MAGTVPGFSLTRMIDSNGNPLAGGFLYIIQAGTTSTPQNAYSDTGLTNLLPNPLVCDGFGWLPQWFVADGNIKVRLTDANGNQQIVADNILVVGPSGSGGGGATVDPTTILSTGDMKLVYGTGTLAGFVRANGRSIGSATSGASERANLDAQSLFEFLWGMDPNLVVSGGRGASAAADWSANKTIALPDFRGRAIGALDDMGNSAAGRLTSTYFGATPTTLGAASTTTDHVTLATANLPPYTPTGTFSGNVSPQMYQASSTSSVGAGGATPVASTNTIVTATVSGNVSMNAQGGTSTPFATLPPEILITVYLKL